MLSKMISRERPYSIGSVDRCDLDLISVTIANLYPASRERPSFLPVFDLFESFRMVMKNEKKS